MTNSTVPDNDDVDGMVLEIAKLRAERDAARAEVRRLKIMLQTSHMSQESVKNNDCVCMALTGF